MVGSFTLHKQMKFSIEDFFSKRDQIHNFCAVLVGDATNIPNSFFIKNHC